MIYQDFERNNFVIGDPFGRDESLRPDDIVYIEGWDNLALRVTAECKTLVPVAYNMYKSRTSGYIALEIIMEYPTGGEKSPNIAFVSLNTHPHPGTGSLMEDATPFCVRLTNDSLALDEWNIEWAD